MERIKQAWWVSCISFLVLSVSAPAVLGQRIDPLGLYVGVQGGRNFQDFHSVKGTLRKSDQTTVTSDSFDKGRHRYAYGINVGYALFFDLALEMGFMTFPEVDYHYVSGSDTVDTHVASWLGYGALRYAFYDIRAAELYLKAGLAHSNNKRKSSLVTGSQANVPDGANNNYLTYLVGTGVRYNFSNKMDMGLQWLYSGQGNQDSQVVHVPASSIVTVSVGYSF